MFERGASNILERVILSTLRETDTLHQAFLHSNTMNAIENGTSNVNENDQIEDGVGDLAFDHGLPE